MGFSVGMALDEKVDRGAIERIKLELKERFKHHAFSTQDLHLLYPGESNLSLLYDGLHLRDIHINLVYALVEFRQQNQLKVSDRNASSFYIKS